MAIVPGGAWAEDRVVTNIFESGSETTRPFTVGDGWELQWEGTGASTGTTFGAFLYSEGGKVFDIIAYQPLTDPEARLHGSSYQQKGGTYCISIGAPRPTA